MKKTNQIVSVLLLTVVVLFSFASCKKDNTPTPGSSSADSTTAPESKGTCTIVVGTDPATEYKVDLDKVTIEKGLMSVLEYLQNEGKLTYTAQDSSYGAFLTQVGDLKQDESTQTYIYLYTSVEADADVSEYKQTIEYGGTTLTSSGLGASEMTVSDGAIIYIGTIKY